MTVLFYGVIFFSPFVFSTDNALDYGFWIYSDITGIKTWYMVLPLLTASALSLAMFSFFNFRLGSAVHLFTDKGIDSSIAQMNEILSDSLHSQKNLLFSIYITASGGDESPERAEAALKKIELLSRDSLDKVSEQLDALREIRLKVKTENITDLIDEVLERISFPQNVRAFKNYRMKERCEAVSKVDQYHISQVFVNILNNAFEAIEEAHRDEGRIVITVRDQFQWVLISVEDNGTGIRKKALKRVFEPWYSGKGGRFNRGLGLSYAYKIIKAHYGLIRIESRYGEGAVVYIMLPKTEETA
jgi:signal transduction histidine kinase